MRFLLCIYFDVMLGRFRTHISFLFFVYETVNKIGDKGANAIAEALKKNTTLEELLLHSKYHTHSPSFSHDSRFDLASCVCTTVRRSFLLQNTMIFNKMILSCVVFYCVCGSGIV